MTVPQSFLARSAPLLRARCLAVAARRAATRQASEHHSFTAAGDGIMAVFGAPVALEDHAIRACLAALGIHEEAKRLAAGVQDRDCVELRVELPVHPSYLTDAACGQTLAKDVGLDVTAKLMEKFEQLAAGPEAPP